MNDSSVLIDSRWSFSSAHDIVKTKPLDNIAATWDMQCLTVSKPQAASSQSHFRLNKALEEPTAITPVGSHGNLITSGIMLTAEQEYAFCVQVEKAVAMKRARDWYMREVTEKVLYEGDSGHPHGPALDDKDAKRSPAAVHIFETYGLGCLFESTLETPGIQRENGTNARNSKVQNPNRYVTASFDDQ